MDNEDLMHLDPAEIVDAGRVVQEALEAKAVFS
jgi:hypothetical protein